MLVPPDLPDGALVACLRDDFGLRVREVAFLPLGADRDSAVYRVVTDDGTPYFLKLRRGAFDATTVAIPRFLRDQGIGAILAPIATHTGRLWAQVDAFAATLAPLIDGRDGFEAPLSDRQWVDLGAALRGMHTADVPPAIRARLPREEYSSQWRDLVRDFQKRVASSTFSDPVAAELAAFMRAKHDIIADLVGRAEHLAASLRQRPPERVLCHADIHAGNVLIAADGALYIVDWDTAVLAPKERDLMFIGGGIGGVWLTAREAALFYRGYGQVEVDRTALAYYRYERIVEDIAVFCEELLPTDAGSTGADRAQSLEYFLSLFRPNSVIEIAYRSDETSGMG